MVGDTTQKNIAIETGDVIGGNQSSITNNYNGPITQVANLLNEFEREQNSNSSEKNEVLDELMHYLSAISEEKVRGLEEKLNAANRQEEYQDASRRKELFAKKLHQYSTSKSAQKLFLFLLGELLDRFKVYVRPKIEAKDTKEAINRAVFEDVISPTINGLDRNLLELYHDHIWGMIYYLTGNCYIRWDSEC